MDKQLNNLEQCWLLDFKRRNCFIKVSVIAALFGKETREVADVLKSVLSPNQYAWFDYENRAAHEEYILGVEAGVNFEGVLKLSEHFGFNDQEVIKALWKSYVTQCFNFDLVSREQFLNVINS